MKCTNCEFEMDRRLAICPNCGQDLEYSGKFRSRCYRCGRIVSQWWKLCPQCGADLDRRYFAWWMLPVPLLTFVALILFILPQIPANLLTANASLPLVTQLPPIALVPPSATATHTPVPSFTPTPTRTPTATSTASATPSPTATPTESPTATEAPTSAATEPPRPPTSTPTPSVTPTHTVTPTPTMVYRAPKLISPEPELRITGGEGTRIELSWEGPAQLAPNEWYGLSVRYLSGGQRRFSGARLKENKWVVPPELAGKADEPDRAYEWDVVIVTVETTVQGVETSREISPKSETRTFYWR